jgi:hypothetical protein
MSFFVDLIGNNEGSFQRQRCIVGRFATVTKIYEAARAY